MNGPQEYRLILAAATESFTARCQFNSEKENLEVIGYLIVAIVTGWEGCGAEAPLLDSAAHMLANVSLVDDVGMISPCVGKAVWILAESVVARKFRRAQYWEGKRECETKF